MQQSTHPRSRRPAYRARNAVRRRAEVAQVVALRHTLRLVAACRPKESGQGTVEYALVLLGAAAVALLLVAWVARTDLVGRLFDSVVGKILSRT